MEVKSGTVVCITYKKVLKEFTDDRGNKHKSYGGYVKKYECEAE